MDAGTGATAAGRALVWTLGLALVAESCFQRSKSSSWTRAPVFASRYFTMTADWSERPHFDPVG